LLFTLYLASLLFLRFEEADVVLLPTIPSQGTPLLCQEFRVLKYTLLFLVVFSASQRLNYISTSTSSLHLHFFAGAITSHYADNMNMNMNKQRVRFAPTCQLIVFVDKTRGIEDELWYSNDDVDRFQLYTTLYSEAVIESICQGSFEGELGDILGLEKLLFNEAYYDRRAAMKVAVLEEHRWQRLSRELRWQRGLTAEVDGHQADIDVMNLANVAEKYSSWAKERAFIAGFTLQSNLCTCNRAKVGGAQITSRKRPREQPVGAKESSSDEVTSTGLRSIMK
jgi:hypothetical protein